MVTIGGRAHTLEEIEAVGKLGYPFAEIDLKDPEVLVQQSEKIEQLRKKYHLFYLAHYPNEGDPRNVNHLETHFVPKMKALFSISRDMGIKTGTMHFWMDNRWASPSLIQQKTELLFDMAADAASKEVVLCLENLTAQYDTFSKIFDAIPTLRMTLDIGHGELLTEKNTSFGFIDHLFHRIRHVHVHDNYGGTGVKDDLHLPLGEGIVDYPAILSLLKKQGYDRTLTMEVKPVDMPKTLEAIERHLF